MNNDKEPKDYTWKTDPEYIKVYNTFSLAVNTFGIGSLTAILIIPFSYFMWHILLSLVLYISYIGIRSIHSGTFDEILQDIYEREKE